MFKKIKKRKIVQKEALFYWILLGVIGTVALINWIWSISQTQTLFTELDRGLYGSGNKTVNIAVTGQYNGVSVTRDQAQIIIREQVLTMAEKEARIMACKERLPQLILGQNSDLRDVVYPLHFPSTDQETGVTLKWQSDHPELVDEKGNIDCIAADQNPYAAITATLTLHDLESQWTCNVKVSQMQESDRIAAAIDAAIDQELHKLSVNEQGSVLALTEKTSTGIEFKWGSTSSFNGLIYLILFVGGCLMIYTYKRQQQIRKKTNRKLAVELAFPDFLNKVVMLLSAGLVLTDAFETIAADYLNYRNQKNRKILYEEFVHVLENAKETNGSFVEGLMKLGEEWEVKALTRFSVIVGDNLEKGNGLAEKLDMESQLLWQERKNRGEELGRLADTKLTFPLMIILLALIIITVVPAIMEM